MKSIVTNLQFVQQRIENAQKKFGREQEPIQLVAVSKKQSVEKITEAIDAGLWMFGENYAQEGITKIQALKTIHKEHPLEWHFIGTIQSNKCTAIAEHFSWVHSVSSAIVAQRLNHARETHTTPLNVCIQVNLEDLSQPSGIAISEVLKLADLIMSLPKLRLRGLMTLPKVSETFEEQRKPFRQLARVLLDLQRAGFPVDTLSMGMSQDLEAAIAEGATILRIGTALFGERI
jgi:pyridoxal phosphate enzyme (YggS family)